MMAAKEYAADRLAMRRIAAHQHLVGQAHLFMADPERKLEFSDPAIPDYLTHVLYKEGLIAFNRQVRNAIPRLKIGVSSSPYWAVVDATGFWEDATPGRWPNMTPASMAHLLGFAEAYQAAQSLVPEELAA